MPPVCPRPSTRHGMDEEMEKEKEFGLVALSVTRTTGASGGNVAQARSSPVPYGSRHE